MEFRHNEKIQKQRITKNISRVVFDMQWGNVKVFLIVLKAG